MVLNYGSDYVAQVQIIVTLLLYAFPNDKPTGNQTRRWMVHLDRLLRFTVYRSHNVKCVHWYYLIRNTVLCTIESHLNTTDCVYAI